jgi:hypothetical protein
MALQMINDFPGNGMTYQQFKRVEVDRNLLFNIVEVTNRYSKDAVGLCVPLSEVFSISMYRFGTNKFFNQALELLQDQGFITRTAFTVTLTPAGFDYIYGI